MLQNRNYEPYIMRGLPLFGVLEIDSVNQLDVSVCLEDGEYIVPLGCICPIKADAHWNSYSPV